MWGTICDIVYLNWSDIIHGELKKQGYSVDIYKNTVAISKNGNISKFSLQENLCKEDKIDWAWNLVDFVLKKEVSK